MFSHFLEQDPTAPPVPKAAVEEEEKVFQKCVHAFNSYESHSLATISKKRKDFMSARANLRALLPTRFSHDSISSSNTSGSGISSSNSTVTFLWDPIFNGNGAGQDASLDDGMNVFERRLMQVEARIRDNAVFLKEMVAAMGIEPSRDGTSEVNSETSIGDSSSSVTKFGNKKSASTVLDGDMDKVRSTLRQFVRDWSVDGANERRDTYTPILDTLERLYSHLQVSERGGITVLVPGAGLGRLAFDIVRRGFSTQGNEFSFYMLIASNFVLNSMKSPNCHTIYPWIHSFSNIQRAEDQLRPIQIPDVSPGGIPETADFSMVAGDFLEVYGGYKERGAWDILVSCYFIDTAKNIFEYLGVIWNALKPGGIWINHGPLLYHFEGMRSEMSIELNLEEVKSVARSMGFVFEEERMMESTYTGNEQSMLKYVYNCAFWVARKPVL